MNEIKALGVQAGELVAKLRAYTPDNGDGPTIAPGGSLDQRWVSIGATTICKPA